MTGPLTQLAGVIRRETGISLKGGRLQSLEAALRRLTPPMDAAAFLEAGGADRSELMARLVDQITVKETFFFRQRQELDAIDWSRLRAGAAASGSDRVRVWVAACASGEEAYSIAVLASDALGGDQPPVSILATDISESALTEARHGRYGKRSARPLDDATRGRYFSCIDGATVVGDRLRSIVEFRRHNLVRDPIPPLPGCQFELVVCRNVMIYFDGDTVERVIASLERALSPQGMLVLGATDRLCGSARQLARWDGTKPAKRETARALRRPLGRDTGDTTAARGKQPLTGAALYEALAAANAGRLDAAVEITTRVLAENPLDAEAHFVRGLAELGLGDAHAAAESFRRALYIDPDHGLAAFKLGRAHEERGDRGAAARAYDQALRALERGNTRDPGSLGDVDMGDVSAACAIRLRSLATEPAVERPRSQIEPGPKP